MNYLEQSMYQANREVLAYLDKLTNPRHDVRSTVIFRMLRQVVIPDTCLTSLETRAKSMGTLLSFLSREEAGSQMKKVKQPLTFTIQVIDKFILKVQYAVEREEDQIGESRVMGDLKRLADSGLQIKTSIQHASVNTGVRYCLLCWRHPAAGKNTIYCNIHHPDSHYDKEDRRFIYDTADYHAGRRLLDRASKILEVRDENTARPEQDRKRWIYMKTWGDIKIKSRRRFRYSIESIAAMRAIFNDEQELCAEIYMTRELGERLPDTHAWGKGNSWREFAENIATFVTGHPELSKEIPITPPIKIESLTGWLNRLSNFISKWPEFDEYTKPSEVVGILSRYAEYKLLLEMAPPPHSTRPNLTDREACIRMIDNGESYAETGRRLNKSRQWAWRTYKKYGSKTSKNPDGSNS